MAKALIVFAHPEQRSFSAAMCDRSAEVLRQTGYDVEVSDLYAMRWKSCPDRSDFSNSDFDRFDPAAVQEAASETGDFTPDVLAEQRKLAEADLLIFQFPMW